LLAKALAPACRAEMNSPMITETAPQIAPPSSDLVSGTRRAIKLCALLVLAWVPAALGQDALRSAAALFPLAGSAHPYWVPEHAWNLYFWTPLVVVSACLLLLSPGLLLSLALNAAKGVGEWIATGFGLSLVVVTIAAAVVQSAIGAPLKEGRFTAVVVVCSLLCFGLLLIRLRGQRQLAWPLDQPHSLAALLPAVIVPLVLLIALTPKFYWENFNGDGAHGFETARLLLAQSLPFWNPSAGDVASFPSINSVLFTFPASWFIRLFGDVEASARLPFLLDLVALYGGLLALIAHGRKKLLGVAEHWLIWLALSVYALMMAFSATYNAYAADIAVPGTQDTLLMVGFLGFIWAFLRRERGWMYLFTVLTYLTLPNGVLLIGFWLLSVFVVWRPRPWRQMVEAAAGVFGCLVIAGILKHLLAAFDLPAPGDEYGAFALLHHFAWLQWSDWHRFVYVIVPSGILPAAALLLWRRQDQLARTLTVLTIVYFGFFYVQAYVGLHYFVPAMLLPLIIFWRNDLISVPRYRPLILGPVAAAGVVALLVSLPANSSLDMSARLVGGAIEDRIGGYEAFEPVEFKGSELLYHLFPTDWDPKVPDESYGGSAVAWNYYAQRNDDPGADVNYVLQRTADQPPAGMRLLAEEGPAALYVRSDSVWAGHRALRPPTPPGSRTYEIPRGILFRSIPLKDGPQIISVVDVLEGLGIETKPILNRLGVKR
jgi:hypothetical protein